jgi:hypothetical protein
MLPQDFRPWAVDIAERMQCPLDFVAIPAMVAAGSLIGRRIGIRPELKTDWTEVGNLWGCIVGRPGAMKSPVISEVLAPIKRLEAEAAKRNDQAKADYGRAETLHKLQLEMAKAKAKREYEVGDMLSAKLLLAEVEEPELPAERRFMTTDATVEKLGMICSDNPEGILLYRDELLTMFQELDREEKAPARGFLLTGWGGCDGYTFDRVGRGTVRVPAVNLSVLGSAQPARIGRYLKDSLRSHDDGMVQRAFSCSPGPITAANGRARIATPTRQPKRLLSSAMNVLLSLRRRMLEPSGTRSIREMVFHSSALLQMLWRSS